MPKKPIELEREILQAGWILKNQEAGRTEIVLNRNRCRRYIMLSIYPACFFKEQNGYSVVFPDLNDLATCGETVEEAMTMAVDCMAGYLYTCRMEGDEFPEPSSIDKISLAREAADMEISPENAFVNMISVDVEEYARIHFEKAVKKTLTIPAWLNAQAMERGFNFSQILQEALKEKLRACK